MEQEEEEALITSQDSTQASQESIARKSSKKTLVRPRKPANPDYITQDLIDRYVGVKTSISKEQIRLLLRDSRDSILKERLDSLDYSNSPSFSKLTSPYHLICRERFRLNKKLYDRQFQYEIKKLIEQQTSAFDAVCLVRVMALTSLWPPLHTRRNLDHTHQRYFQLPPKARKRLDFIMTVDWSKT